MADAKSLVAPAPIGPQDSSALVWFWQERVWLHVVLLAATLVSTTAFGYALDACFRRGVPFESDLIWVAYQRLWHGDWTAAQGLSFSVPLLLILLAHEMGHYCACRWWRVRASLPYFLPSPTLLGTLGAFIRIRSPIYSRRSLFDIGVWGPLAGFAALLPILVWGLSLSRIVPQVASRGDFIFSTPLLIRLCETIAFPKASTANIALHPLARAAWAGLLATSINLLPIGQLDGGHLLYALAGNMHRSLSRLGAAALFGLGLLYRPWLLWAVVLFFLGTRHPLIYDSAPLGRHRLLLAGATLLVFLLSFSPVPVRW